MDGKQIICVQYACLFIPPHDHSTSSITPTRDQGTSVGDGWRVRSGQVTSPCLVVVTITITIVLVQTIGGEGYGGLRKENRCCCINGL